MQLIIVTGISGSGKSLAINVLEDAGFFCIDNLPVQYLLDVAMSLEREGQSKVAVSVDARVGKSLAGLREVVMRLRDEGHDIKVLFLNARTDALVQRYSETRRRHPLTTPAAGDSGPTLEESIERERDIMSEIEDLGLSIGQGRSGDDDDPVRVLRLQARRPARRRPGVRRPLPAQPLLHRRAAPPDRPRQAGRGLPRRHPAGSQDARRHQPVS
jgi:hypothetical protein